MPNKLLLFTTTNWYQWYHGHMVGWTLDSREVPSGQSLREVDLALITTLGAEPARGRPCPHHNPQRLSLRHCRSFQGSSRGKYYVPFIY